MKYIRKRCAAYAAAILLCLITAFPAQASQVGGTTTISVSESSMEVGDRLTVTVKPSADGTIRLRYNGSVLRLTDCNAAGYTTEGSEVSYSGGEATLTFQAVSAGSSGLIVSSDTLTGSSTTVQVADPAAAEEPQEITTPQETAGSQTEGTASQPEGQFTIDGVAYVASERYSSSEIPAGFNTVQLEIQGSTYRELSNGQMTLIYLKPASNIEGSGTFYIYHADDQSVTQMTLIGTMEDYVIAFEPSEIPANLSVTTFLAGDRQINAYVINGSTDNFYYLYGMDENGTEQWYQYDGNDGSIQRANMALLTAEEGWGTSEAAAAGDDSDQISKLRIVIAVLAFVAVVLLIAVINLLLGRRRNRGEACDMTDDDLEDEQDLYSESGEEEKRLRSKILQEEFGTRAGEAVESYEEPEIEEAEETEDDAEDVSEADIRKDTEEEEDDEEWHGFFGINDSLQMDSKEEDDRNRPTDDEDNHVTEELQRELDQLNMRGKEAKKRRNDSENTGRKSGKNKDDEEEELDFSDLEILDLNDL